MLSAQPSCLEIHAFFYYYFFLGLMSPPSFFSRRAKREREKKRGEQCGEEVRREVSRIRCKQTEPNWGKWLETHSFTTGPRVWKTNLKPNLGNQLRSLQGLKKKKKVRTPLSSFTFLPFPSLPLREEALSAEPLFHFFNSVRPYMLSKCLKSLIKEMPQLISL